MSKKMRFVIYIIYSILYGFWFTSSVRLFQNFLAKFNVNMGNGCILLCRDIIL